MITHNVQQNSQEWLALRANYFTASEAPAMMGCSPYMTRTELLHAKKTGITPEIDERTQSRFDAGHAAEAAFRPHAEAIIGQDLYPVTGSLEIDGLKLLASFDGLTADDMIGFEHKSYNKDLAQAIELDGELPPAYYWQLEQQLLISGASYILFATTNGTKDKCAMINYASFPGRREALLAGWAQFAEDIESYVPQEYIPAPVAQAVTALPAVAVQVTGSIDIRDNFKVFEAALTDFIDNRLIRDPKTDQDFADLDLQIKALKQAEEALDAAEANMLSQVESVDTAKRMKDMLHKVTRDNRLMMEKVLAAKKESVKVDIVNAGRKELLEHVEALNARLGKPYMPAAVADFQGAIKGKRTVDSIKEAVNVTLANAKIAASAQADKIEINLKALRELAKDHAFLFADTPQIVMKANDDLVLLINSRIDAHKAAEQKRLEAERERIRAEEAKKLADEAAANTQRLADAEAARVAREAAEAVALSQPKPEEPAHAAPVVASVSPAPAVASPLRSFASASVASSEASATVLAFLASRNWPTPATEKTARATLIEYSKFCAQQMKAAA